MSIEVNKTERIIDVTVIKKFGKSIEADIDIANQRVGFKQEGEANFTYIDLPKLTFDELTEAQQDSLKLTFDQLTQAEKDSLKLTFDDLTQAEKDSLKGEKGDIAIQGEYISYATLADAQAVSPKPSDGTLFQVEEEANRGVYTFQSGEAGGTRFERSFEPVRSQEYIEFSDPLTYKEDGTLNSAYGGYHKEHLITEAGIYTIGWSLGGSVRWMHAIDNNGVILESWNGNYFSAGNNRIDVPKNSVKLLLSSEGSPKNGYLTKIKQANEDEYGYVTETQIKNLSQPLIDESISSEIGKLTIPELSDEPPFIDILGNPWEDGYWKNGTSQSTVCRVYTINDNEQYDLFYDPKSQSFQQTFSSIEINAQLNTNDPFSPITYNGGIFSNLSNDRDVITVNGFSVTKKTITNFTPPTGAKRLIIMLKYNDVDISDQIKIFKRKGAKGHLIRNNNANKKIVVCGDSIAQNNETEFGKEKLRDSLGCKVDTYAMGGSGWSINATPGWVTPNNVSGVYQVEELVKPESETYDIYCLSATLNDPITHIKPIGSITNCKPYLKNAGQPDFTDPNLDTMLGGLNFAIQRIYEKNPSAKIVIGTMNKCFLDEVTNGFGVEAGYNPDDTTTNSHGSTYYDYVEAVRKLGEYWGLPIVEIYSNAGINEYNKSITMIDKYHPTIRGYEGIWNLWFNAILNA